MSATPINISTNISDDEPLPRVTRSGALFGVPTVLVPGEESSLDLPPQVERASSAPSESAQVYVSDVTPGDASPSDRDNPDPPHGEVSRPAPVEAPRQPEVIEPPPRPETQETSGLGQLASVLERMMNAQGAQAEQQGKLLERVLALTNKTNEGTEDKGKERHYTRGVEKLRLEGIPRWPSLDRHTNMPYYIFAEDLKVWLSLMNHKYGEVLKHDADNNDDISPADNAIVLRYICAALTNPTVSTHIAQNYAGDGRKAWKQLHLQFGLPSTSQSALRQSLDRLVLSPHADAGADL